MKIIEKFILGKNKDQNKCEDLIYTGERFMAVIDGATSKDGRSFEGKTGGRVAAEIVYNALLMLEKTNKNTAKEISDFISAQFIPFYNEYEIDYISEPTSKIVASCVIYDNLSKQLIFVGDCLAIIEKDGNLNFIENSKFMDEVTSNTRSLHLSSLIKTGQYNEEELRENDLGRDFILPLLKNQLAFQNQNIKFGYECFDGTEIPENMIKTVSIEKGSILYLSSDGYPKLFKTLKESEEYLNYVLKEDPLLYKIYPSTKGHMKGLNSFDDRSYLSFKID